MVCRVCGRSPAAFLRIRRAVGLVIVARWWKIDAPFCRTHGEAQAKDWLIQTLLEGWTSVTSFLFMNPVAIIFNIVALVRAKRLPSDLIGTSGNTSRSTTQSVSGTRQVPATALKWVCYLCGGLVEEGFRYCPHCREECQAVTRDRGTTWTRDDQGWWWLDEDTHEWVHDARGPTE